MKRCCHLVFFKDRVYNYPVPPPNPPEPALTLPLPASFLIQPPTNFPVGACSCPCMRVDFWQNNRPIWGLFHKISHWREYLVRLKPPSGEVKEAIEVLSCHIQGDVE